MNAGCVTILGIGAVTYLGRNLEEISRRLGEPAGTPTAVLRVEDELLADPVFSRNLRRADRFARMAAIAAVDAWKNSRPPEVSTERVGLIVSSGLGPHGRGFKFLDGVLDCGDLEGLPTDFSHSVHAAAASYITGLLDLRGPSLSTTDFEVGFENAVLLAQCWLERKICDRVVVGAVEELGDVLNRVAARMLEGKAISLGEGAVFLVLGRADCAGIAKLSVTEPRENCDLLVLDAPAIPPMPAPPPAKCTATFSPYFGHCASGSAFELLGALLSMSKRRPLGKVLHSGGRPSVDNATTFRTSCGQAIGLHLLRQ